MHAIGKLMLFAMALSGCAGRQETRPFVVRFDGTQVDKVALEQSTIECRAKAEIATVNMPQGYNFSSSLARSMEQGRVQNVAMHGCLAEKGMKVVQLPVDERRRADPSNEPSAYHDRLSP